MAMPPAPPDLAHAEVTRNAKGGLGLERTRLQWSLAIAAVRSWTM